MGVVSTVKGMQFLIELDGPVVDIRPRYYRAHRLVQGELGLASRDADEFWRLVRKGAGAAEIVRPHRSGQLAAYAQRFEAALLSDSLLELDVPQKDVVIHVSGLREVAPCSLVSVRPDRQATQRLLDRHELWRHFRILRLLSQDRSVRMSQLTDWVRQSDQTVAAVASETMVLSAREAGAVVVGVANGASTPRRLRQAGADMVVADLGELVEAVQQSSDELIRAGYRPPHRRDPS